MEDNDGIIDSVETVENVTPNIRKTGTTAASSQEETNHTSGVDDTDELLKKCERHESSKYIDSWCCITIFRVFVIC